MTAIVGLSTDLLIKGLTALHLREKDLTIDELQKIGNIHAGVYRTVRLHEDKATSIIEKRTPESVSAKDVIAELNKLDEFADYGSNQEVEH